MSIFNAYDNRHTIHLNEHDLYNYYAIKDVPILTAKAIYSTLFFILVSFSVQIYTYFKSHLPVQKKIILSLLSIYLILFGFSGFLLSDLTNRDFYDYGMIWVLLNLLLIFGNSILLFIKR